MILTSEQREVLTAIKMQRDKIVRRKRSLHLARAQMAELVNEASSMGVGKTKIARAAGMHVSRVYQLNGLP